MPGTYICCFILITALSVARPAVAADVPDFVKACTSSSNLDAVVCECAGKKAQTEMSPKAFDFLVATLAGDQATTDKLRPQLSVEEAMKAGTFMARGPSQCARQKSVP